MKGGFESWSSAGKEVDVINSMTAEQLSKARKEQKLNIIDVRKPTEYTAEHVEDAENVPLDFINENMAQLKKGETYYLHCASGYRSVIMASILKARGYEHITDIAGGFQEIRKTDIPTTDYVCPTTM